MVTKVLRKDMLKKIKNILLVIGGTCVLAFGTGIFLIPFDLVTGGMSGLAIILVNIIPIEAITIDIYVFILTWLLFFIGLIILGKEFAIKTLISAIVYPIALSASLKLINTDLFNGFFNITSGQYANIAILLSALFGGVFVGAGCAITFIGGGSTGGTDILAFILCKYFKKLKSSVVIFVLDALIVIGGIFVLKDFVISLLGIFSAFVCALVIDKLFLGGSKAFVAQIVSDSYKQINEAIIKELDRTTTVFNAVGGYSNKDKKVIMISFSMSQYTQLLSIINKYDKDAFVTISRAHEINGEGWTK